ncbi:MAG: hypothetical protein ACKVZ0_16030 [Gemmatimonadales bacterium]
MSNRIWPAAPLLMAMPAAALGQHDHHHHDPGATMAVADTARPAPHSMWMRSLGRGYHLMGMAQVFPVATTGTLRRGDAGSRARGFYATQPVAMINVSSPGSRVVFRTTLDLEGITIPDGELTFGGWGEGFLDSRHPHTLVHEAMFSVNLWRGPLGGSGSISFGKGFVPYGTDDPMSRPVLKYPSNHHLSQILERWTVNGQYLTRNGWGFEAAVFGGDEPDGPYDFSNISSFGDSWAVRLSKRFGADGPFAPWEISASYARVAEAHHQRKEVTRLHNVAVRHSRRYQFGDLYALAEGSVSRPASGDGDYAFLAEVRLDLGKERRHQPYGRIEVSTRPEYARLGAPGTPDFFRYDHDAHSIGATRWVIASLGYGREITALPVSVRPFAELQYHRVGAARGDVQPGVLFGRNSFWSLSTGFRIFLGGGPMRMGSYGVLDPMSAAMSVSHRQLRPEGPDLHPGRTP